MDVLTALIWFYVMSSGLVLISLSILFRTIDQLPESVDTPTV